jgi:cation-transporting ATPase E
MWVLVLIARPLDRLKVALIAVMTAAMCLLLAVPLSRRIFALQLPAGPVLTAIVAVVLAAIVALTVWRRRPHR